MEKNISPSDFYELVTGEKPILNNYIQENHLSRPLNKRDLEKFMPYAELLDNHFGDHVRKLKEHYGESNVKLFESELENLLGHICFA